MDCTFATYYIALNNRTACSLHHFSEWDVKIPYHWRSLSNIRDSKFSRFASKDTLGILTNSALQQQLSLLNKICISQIFSTKEIRTAMANLQCKSMAVTDFRKRILIKKSFNFINSTNEKTFSVTYHTKPDGVKECKP